MAAGIVFRNLFLWLFRIVAAILLFIFTLGVVLHIDPIMRRQKESFKKNVEKNTPNLFPVLILIPATKEGKYEAKIIPYGDLPAYQEEFKTLTFLVPPQLETELNTQLRVFCHEQGKLHRQDYKKNREDCFSAGFNIEKQSPGRQSLRVVYMFDDDRPNTGWYEATDKQIFPKYHEFYFGPALLFSWGIVDFLISILLAMFI